jgi:hypothetical protein
MIGTLRGNFLPAQQRPSVAVTTEGPAHHEEVPQDGRCARYYTTDRDSLHFLGWRRGATMNAYPLDEVLTKWSQDKLTAEQAIGQILLHLRGLQTSVTRLEQHCLPETDDATRPLAGRPEAEAMVQGRRVRKRRV